MSNPKLSAVYVSLDGLIADAFKINVPAGRPSEGAIYVMPIERVLREQFTGERSKTALIS